VLEGFGGKRAKALLVQALGPYPSQHSAGVFEGSAALLLRGVCQEVVDDAHTNVVAPAAMTRGLSPANGQLSVVIRPGSHAVQLPVHFVVGFVVLQELCHLHGA
jgi:hypothetical protein